MKRPYKIGNDSINDLSSSRFVGRLRAKNRKGALQLVLFAPSLKIRDRRSIDLAGCARNGRFIGEKNLELTQKARSILAVENRFAKESDLLMLLLEHAAQFAVEQRRLTLQLACDFAKPVI